MKAFIIGILVAASTSAFGQEIKLAEGLYLTSSRHFCHQNVVPIAGKLIITEEASTPDRECYDAGKVSQYSYLMENVYTWQSANGHCEIEVKSEKSYLINCTRKDGSKYDIFFKLLEFQPQILPKPLKGGWEATSLKLRTEEEKMKGFNQAVAGIGDCKVVICENGSLQVAVSDKKGKQREGCVPSMTLKPHYTHMKAMHTVHELISLSSTGYCDQY